MLAHELHRKVGPLQLLEPGRAVNHQRCRSTRSEEAGSGATHTGKISLLVTAGRLNLGHSGRSSLTLRAVISPPAMAARTRDKPPSKQRSMLDSWLTPSLPCYPREVHARMGRKSNMI